MVLGMVERRIGRLMYAVAPGIVEMVIAADLVDPFLSLRPGAVRFPGRGLAVGIDLGDQRAIVRTFRHGGFFGPLLGRLYLSHRGRAEAAVAAEARGRGIPVPETLAVIEETIAGPLHREWIVTARIPGRTLDEILRTAGPAEVGRTAALAARALRDAHDRGFRHPDLNLRNLLAGDEGVTFIDLDRARLGPPLGESDRHHALARMLRSYLKLGHASVRPAARFLREYEPDREARKRAAAAIRRALSLRGKRGLNPGRG